MSWTGTGRTDVGCERTKNEDSFVVDNASGLFLVADGMGGHAGGEVASEMVASQLPALVRHSFEKGHALHDPVFHVMIQEDVTAVNDLLVREGIRRDLAGMGSTFVMLLIKGPHALLVHVGDSRVYRYREGQLELLTSDHASTTYPNMLTRVMGMDEPFQADITSVEADKEDVFLLCSDGLNHMLSDADIEAVYTAGPSRDCAERLIAAAKEAGGHDNITVVHVLFED